MKKILVVLFSCLSLFAEEIKEYEFALPFEFEVNTKGEETNEYVRVLGALLQLRSGEVIIAGNATGNNAAFENPFYMVRDEDFDEEVSLRSINDGREFADGEQIASVTGEKILRRVVSVDNNQVVFDDGYVIFRLTDVQFPHSTCLNIGDSKFSLVLHSMYPLILEGEIDAEELFGKMVLNCTYGVQAQLEVMTSDGESGFASFLAGEDFKTAFGLGEYREGESYYFCPLAVDQDFFKQILEQDVLDNELFLIYRAY